MRSRAIVIDRPGRHRLVIKDMPEPAPGDALVRIAAAGVCGSDRDLFDGTRPEQYVKYPVTPGHEWSGTVVAVGPGVDAGLVGRVVVGETFHACLSCQRCLSGETNLCATGYAETGFSRPGAYAEHLLLPARLLHPLPDGTDLRAAALLEPAAVIASAVMKAVVEPGERVAVVGAGTLGQLAVQFLAAAAPGELVVVDPRADRNEAALICGATGALTPAQARAAAGTADVVIETAGVATSARDAAALARRGGRVVLTGIPMPGASGLDPTDLVVRQLTVGSVWGAKAAAWTHAVAAFTSGVLNPAPLVTHDLPLEAYREAIDLISGGDLNVGKVLLHP